RRNTHTEKHTQRNTHTLGLVLSSHPSYTHIYKRTHIHTHTHARPCPVLSARLPSASSNCCSAGSTDAPLPLTAAATRQMALAHQRAQQRAHQRAPVPLRARQGDAPTSKLGFIRIRESEGIM